MKNLPRAVFVLCAALCLGTTLAASPAAAKTTHHKHHVAHKQPAPKNNRLRTAQLHLMHLGYYSGSIDGLMGPKTRTALKNFQRNRMLPVSGKLTVATYNALVDADLHKQSLSALSIAAPRPDFYVANPDYYGHIDQTYSDPTMLGAPQTIPTRYGNVSLNEEPSGAGKRYSISLNGRPLMRTDDQPAPIGVSRTYDLGAEDAIILSAYRNNDTLCPYEHYVLALTANGSSLHQINNCSRGYQAKVNSDSLFIVFPESDDGRAVGATWRYENGDMERL